MCLSDELRTRVKTRVKLAGDAKQLKNGKKIRFLSINLYFFSQNKNRRNKKHLSYYCVGGHELIARDRAGAGTRVNCISDRSVQLARPDDVIPPARAR